MAIIENKILITGFFINQFIRSPKKEENEYPDYNTIINLT